MTAPVYVGGTSVAGTSISYSPFAAGNSLILTALAYNPTTLTSITDSQEQTLVVDHTFALVANLLWIGVYRIPACLSGLHTIVANGLGGTVKYLQIDEIANLGAIDTLAGAITPTSGNSTSPATGSLSPSVVDDYLHAAIITTTSVTYSGWLNSFIESSPATGGAGVAYLIQSVKAAVSTGASIGATAHNWAAILLAYLNQNYPYLATVNSGSNIVEGATGVPLAGSSFASGMTSAIAQPGVSVAQATTFVSATSATFNLSMEPAGNQLAFTDSVYPTTISPSTSVGTGDSVSITLVPPTGNLFETLFLPNPVSANSLTATSALAGNDQIEVSGNATGTTAAPTGLVIDSTGGFYFTSGNPVQNFYARAYDTSTKTWGAWALQTVYGVTVSPSSLPAATQGVFYSQTLSGSGGTAPYTFAVTAGALPLGLTLSSAGVLSGTPTAAGASSFTVTATDATTPTPNTGATPYSFTVNTANSAQYRVGGGGVERNVSYSGSPAAYGVSAAQVSKPGDITRRTN